MTSIPAGFMPNLTYYDAYHPQLTVSLPSSLTTIAPGAFLTDISAFTIDDKSGLYEVGEAYNVMWGDRGKTVLVQSTQKEGDIVIPEGVKTVGGNAFYGSSYTTLSIPASLTEISADSFANFKGKFESITVAEGNSVLYVNDDVDSANYGQLCRTNAQGQEEVVLQTEVVPADADGILYSKDGTTLISVTKAFAGGEYTVKEGCTEIADGAFEGCTTLTSISGADVKTVGSSAFSGCTALANVDLPAVESLGGGSAFYGCSSLKSVSFPNVADVPGSTFNGCSSLSEISLPKLSSLGASAFAGTGLTEYTVPASVDATSATGLFSGCSKLKKVDLSAASLGAIPDRFFKDCTALAEVVWPQGGVKSIGELAFQNTGLASVDLSGMAGVTLGGGAFRDCASLASVVLPSGVSLVDAGSNGGQFQGCTKLASIDLSNTKLTSLRSNLFDGCTALSSVKLPSTLEAIGNYAFRNCTSLAALTLPDGLKTIGRESFGGCSSLANVALPSSVTDIESGAFNNTPALIKFTLGPNLWLGVPEESWSKDSDDTWSTGAIFTTTPATTIGRPEADFVAKTSWSSVAEVDLSLYGNHYIPPYTFMGLNKLEEVVIPKQVRTVMEGAFMGCTSLRDVYCFSPDISFVISEGQTGDSSLGWTSKTYPSFCAWGMGIAGQPEVKSLSGINFYGLAYSNNKLLEWCEVSDNTFVPFVVLEDFAADEALALFGYEVTGYNNVAVADLVYTGQALEPQIKVTFTDRDGVAPRMLDASDCQSIVYRDAAGNVVDSIVEPGAYTVTVTGDGKSVFGTQTISFKVVDPGASGGQQGDDQQQNQYQQNQQNQQNQQQYGPYQQGAYQQGATAQQAGYATTQAAQQGAALSQTGDGSPTGPLATVAALALGAATAAATAVRRRTRR